MFALGEQGNQYGRLLPRQRQGTQWWMPALSPEWVRTYVEVHDVPLASWASRRNALTNIVIVELTAFDELETMAGIKTIRSAFFESTHSNREPSHIRLFENLSENSRAYP